MLVALLLIGVVPSGCCIQRFAEEKLISWRVQRYLDTVWQDGLNYRAPLDLVVYEEDPDRKPALLADENWYMSLPQEGHPVCRTVSVEFGNVGAYFGYGGKVEGEVALFSHQREDRQRGGRQLLVAAYFINCPTPPDWDRSGWTFRLEYFHKEGWNEPAVKRFPPLRIPIATSAQDLSQHLRFYAGQPDPIDPRRWTIPYAINNQPGTIDGWLDEQSVPHLAIRDGPAKP